MHAYLFPMTTTYGHFAVDYGGTMYAQHTYIEHTLSPGAV